VSEGPGGAGAAASAAVSRRPPDQAPRSARGDTKLKDVVGRIHRVKRAGKAFDVVVLPHPSGRSTWTNKPENAALLQRSLELIGAHAAWRKTFQK
jgi:uracil-DNA glycosylase